MPEADGGVRPHLTPGPHPSRRPDVPPPRQPGLRQGGRVRRRRRALGLHAEQRGVAGGGGAEHIRDQRLLHGHAREVHQAGHLHLLLPGRVGPGAALVGGLPRQGARCDGPSEGRRRLAPPRDLHRLEAARPRRRARRRRQRHRPNPNPNPNPNPERSATTLWPNPSPHPASYAYA